MVVKAIQCSNPGCGDKIFSRTNHDFRSCSCGSVSIDGGQSDYYRILWDDTEMVSPKPFDLDIGDVTLKDLYNDWNMRVDHYGLIKKNTFVVEKRMDI